METIHYREHILEIVRQPAEGLTDLPTAQTHQDRLQSIGIQSRLIDWPGGYYVTADVLGAVGDVIKSIREASLKETREAIRSGAINRHLWDRVRDRHRRQLQEIEQIQRWIDQHRTQAAQIRHPIYRQRHRSLLDMVREADNLGLTARLQTYQLAKNIIATQRQ